MTSNQPPGGVRRPARKTEESEALTDRPTKPKKPKKKMQSIYFDQDIIDRARAAATHLSAYVPESGIRSLSDIVNPATEALVAQLEREYNGGKPFPPVARMSSGAPRGPRS